jgi:carbohydrate-binding DOMON domain-containing protein
VALLVDTVQALHRNHSKAGYSMPAILISGSGENNQVQKLSKFFQPVKICLYPAVENYGTRTTGSTSRETGYKIISRWYTKVDTTSTSTTTRTGSTTNLCSQELQDSSINYEYCIVQDGCAKKIIWRSTNTKT